MKQPKLWASAFVLAAALGTLCANAQAATTVTKEPVSDSVTKVTLNLDPVENQAYDHYSTNTVRETPFAEGLGYAISAIEGNPNRSYTWNLGNILKTKDAEEAKNLSAAKEVTVTFDVVFPGETPPTKDCKIDLLSFSTAQTTANPRTIGPTEASSATNPRLLRYYTFTGWTQMGTFDSTLVSKGDSDKDGHQDWNVSGKFSSTGTNRFTAVNTIDYAANTVTYQVGSNSGTYTLPAGVLKGELYLAANVQSSENPLYLDNIQMSYEVQQGDPVYSVSTSKAEYTTDGGIVSANTPSAKKGDTITLSNKAFPGFAFQGYTVTTSGGQDVTLSGDTFTMPEDDVTVTGSFALANSDDTVKYFAYDLTTGNNSNKHTAMSGFIKISDYIQGGTVLTFDDIPITKGSKILSSIDVLNEVDYSENTVLTASVGGTTLGSVAYVRNDNNKLAVEVSKNGCNMQTLTVTEEAKAALSGTQTGTLQLDFAKESQFSAGHWYLLLHYSEAGGSIPASVTMSPPASRIYTDDSSKGAVGFEAAVTLNDAQVNEIGIVYSDTEEFTQKKTVSTGNTVFEGSLTLRFGLTVHDVPTGTTLWAKGFANDTNTSSDPVSVTLQ